MTLKKDTQLNYEFQGVGLETKDRNQAKMKFDLYCESYPHLNKPNELSVLEELVYQEVMHEKVKEKIKKNYKSKTAESVAIPKTLQDVLKNGIDLQISLKTKLGMFNDKQALDVWRDFQSTREDFAEYRRSRPEIFGTTCPFCKEKYYLKRRTVDTEPIGTEWFKDKVLFNVELWKIYKEQVPLTKESMAKILGTSDEYIEYLEKRFADIEKKDDEVVDNSAVKDSSKEE